MLGVNTEKLEEFYGQKVYSVRKMFKIKTSCLICLSIFVSQIIIADRFMVEDSAEGIFGSALNSDVALLVVGDPLCATTHTDMMIRARKVCTHPCTHTLI